MKRLLIMLIAIIANVGLTQAQTTDKEERARLRQERKAEQEILDSVLKDWLNY